MKIIPATIPATELAAHRSGPAYDQQWRKALEDAQWQSRQRIAPELSREVSAPAPMLPVDGPATGPQAPVAATDPGAFALRAGPATTLSRADAMTRAIADAIGTPVLGRSTEADATKLVLQLSGGRERPVAAVALVDEPAPVLQPGWTSLPQWPAVSMNASVAGNRISIVMRDQSLEDSDLAELHHALRGQLAAAGLELTDLTVNGRSVLPAGALVSHS